MKNTWIIGCGNTGKKISELLQTRGLNVKATTHSSESAKVLEKLNIETFSANLDAPESLTKLTLDNADIFYFAPPPSSGEVDSRMSHFLNALDKTAPPRRIVYISTTGVYGDHEGKWITEKTATLPHNARSKRRLNAEELIKQFCDECGTGYMILRVSGIYDLNKLPLKRINTGLKVLKPEIAPASNRIHAADLANICVAAMQTTHKNEVFNIADGNPSSISDYFIQTAKIFNLKPPEEISWAQAQDDLSPEMLSYLNESKKIDGSHVLKRLGIHLLFPTLADGLVACKKEYDAQKRTEKRTQS